VPDEDALAVILKGAERRVTVSEYAILAAMGRYLTDSDNMTEGAGAVPLAALLKERDKMAGKKIGLILSRGNADRAFLRQVLTADGEEDILALLRGLKPGLFAGNRRRLSTPSRMAFMVSAAGGHFIVQDDAPV